MASPAVYVVDDDTLVTDSLSRALALETDWRVLAFNDGANALAAMPLTPPDAVQIAIRASAPAVAIRPAFKKATAFTASE